MLAPAELLHQVRELREAVECEGLAILARWRPDITRRAFLPSAVNLARYLALRSRDLRELQADLPPLGLSSLGRSEARVRENLDAVVYALSHLAGEPVAKPVPPHRFYRGSRLLTRNTEETLGPSEGRRVRIMVTLPSQAAGDTAFFADLLRRGANWVRINCAHDDAHTWAAMVNALRAAEQETGRTCRVLMDLAGPKARTGAILAAEDRRVQAGDRILLTAAAPQDTAGHPYAAECQIPEALTQLEPGARIGIDDGKILTEVESLVPAGVVLRVLRVPSKGGKLKSEKGLNFPDTELRISPLSGKDLADLDFVARHAAAVGYSFVQSREDVRLLQRELAARQCRPAIVAKIETATAVRNLPEIIAQAAGQGLFAVMIARGDLAVEIGFERIAEIQEELLWLCEAAHVPVIWATQVLETFVKEGLPTRAEMTDAAMGERAECVMLNKGPHIAQAVTVLDDVLRRMQEHQSKKTPQLRALQSWRQ